MARDVVENDLLVRIAWLYYEVVKLQEGT